MLYQYIYSVWNWQHILKGAFIVRLHYLEKTEGPGGYEIINIVKEVKFLFFQLNINKISWC